MQALDNQERLVTLRAAAAVWLPLGHFQIHVGGMTDFALLGRIPISERHRFMVGASLGGVFNALADHLEVGLPLEFAFGVAPHVELTLGYTMSYTRLFWSSDLFQPMSAFTGRLDFGVAFPIVSHFTLGLAPVSQTVLAGPDIDTVISLTPRFWLEVSI